MRMVIKGYLLKKIKKIRADGHGSYEVLSSYADRLATEEVPPDSRFDWKKIKYIVIVGPKTNIEDLQISEQLKTKLRNILKSHGGSVRAHTE